MTRATDPKKADIVVLLVDDDEDDRFLVSRALEQSPHKVHILEAENGQKGLDVVSDGVKPGGIMPHLIILDLNMPVMDGFTFLKHRRQSDVLSEIPVIVLTTSDEAEVLNEARALGANAALTKEASEAASHTLSQMIIDYWMSGGIDWDFFKPKG
ncbi:MAG: response regulator [Hyphomicrobiaceae bacterium]|nr:response regulator [Hyphomicrobiaceae bacterium]